ncbi:MAG: nucleotide-binding protein [Planctomycetes bacterium]|nr:nucleotide-binding protein [Planctomycetota bacterium]
MDKPPLFIGSSSEGLPLAEAVFAHLSHETKPKLWTHQLFLPGQYPMETLEKQLRVNSFAILVASPDDQLIKRGVESPTMRDNLLLEFGLFTGALGRRRAFFLCPDSPTVELPSDLLGIIVAKYDKRRATGTPDEIAATVQVPCQQIRTVIREQWEIIQKERDKRTERIRASERGKAVERLHGVVIQLRDAVMVVQGDAFVAVSDEPTFNKVKRTAIQKVREIADSFSEDAMLIGADQEVNRLANVTSDALDDLPFPRELSLGQGAAREKIIDTGFGALNTFLSGGDPFRHVEDAATGEAKKRVVSLKHRYIEWWEQHYPIIETATANLQDKLFHAAMDLASTAYPSE